MSGNPLPLQSFPFPNTGPVLVLAPHPDDFDAFKVTMRFFREKGTPRHVAVATSGTSGVEDSFCSPPTPEAKARLRGGEQRASCRFFGLPAAHLAFLRLQEDEASHPVESLANLELQRNLNRRGYGFDERILRMDRQCAKAFSVGAPYAEVFGLELFGARPPLRDLGAGGEA